MTCMLPGNARLHPPQVIAMIQGGLTHESSLYIQIALLRIQHMLTTQLPIHSGVETGLHDSYYAWALSKSHECQLQGIVELQMQPCTCQALE